MTAAVRFRPSRLARLGLVVRDVAIGTLLAAQALTSLLVLGWLTRRMGWIVRTRMGAAEEVPGWILGPRDRGRVARALGGGAANIRSGAMALTALLIWTLPFTALWLGAWWAGWENSFNKGYEQAGIGPTVFLLGTVISVIVLPALPVMLAHLATEDRLSAAFELRRIGGVLAQAGWRLAGLSALTTLCALPLFAGRGGIVLGHDIFPGLEDLTPDAAADLRGQIQLALAALAFGALWFLRGLAARLYAFAAPRAAALRPALWDGTHAAEAARPARRRSRVMTALWYLTAALGAGGLSTLILMGQFLDHAWWRWTLHPFLTLPWPG